MPLPIDSVRRRHRLYKALPRAPPRAMPSPPRATDLLAINHSPVTFAASLLPLVVVGGLLKSIAR